MYKMPRFQAVYQALLSFLKFVFAHLNNGYNTVSILNKLLIIIIKKFGPFNPSLPFLYSNNRRIGLTGGGLTSPIE